MIVFVKSTEAFIAAASATAGPLKSAATAPTDVAAADAFKRIAGQDQRQTQQSLIYVGWDVFTIFRHDKSFAEHLFVGANHIDRGKRLKKKGAAHQIDDFGSPISYVFGIARKFNKFLVCSAVERRQLAPDLRHQQFVRLRWLYAEYGNGTLELGSQTKQAGSHETATSGDKETELVAQAIRHGP